MFGQTYFGKAYFGLAFWGKGADVATPIPVPPTVGGGTIGRPVRREYMEAFFRWRRKHREIAPLLSEQAVSQLKRTETVSQFHALLQMQLETLRQSLAHTPQRGLGKPKLGESIDRLLALVDAELNRVTLLREHEETAALEAMHAAAIARERENARRLEVEAKRKWRNRLAALVLLS
jgi:hypothetical protein